MRRLIAVLALLLPLAGSGCDPAVRQTIENTRFAPHLEVDLSAMQRTSGGVYYRDRVVGEGEVVRSGQRLTAHYKGWLANGQLFEQLQPPQAPFPFILGAREVIRGWDDGIPGMRVGGTRQLVIPSELAYGAQGSRSIPPNSILVFDVTIASAQ